MNSETLNRANDLARKIAKLEDAARRIGSIRQSVGQRTDMSGVMFCLVDPCNHSLDIRLLANEDLSHSSCFELPAEVIESAIGELHNNVVDQLLVARREFEQI